MCKIVNVCTLTTYVCTLMSTAIACNMARLLTSIDHEQAIDVTIEELTHNFRKSSILLNVDPAIRCEKISQP